MQNYGPEQIRNVVLLSHSGAGKTSLSEVMLFTAGAITRLGKVDEGTTTSDYDPDEIKRRISISLSLLPCYWNNTKINLIDTPGYADFVGELKAGVRVADGAEILVCAASGVEVGTEQAWRYTKEANLPCLILVNKMDRDNADFYHTVEEIRTKMGAQCVPIQIPIGAQDSFEGVVDLVKMKAYSGTKLQEREIPSSLGDKAQSFREKLIEVVAETDDELIAKYIEGKEISEAEIRNGLRQAVKSGRIVPIMVGAALKTVGIPPLFDAICEYLPSPKDRGSNKVVNAVTNGEEVIEPNPSASLAALVFKTSADPYVGKLTYFRVYSGSIYSNSQVWNSNKKEMERIGQLFLLRGKTQEAALQFVAGDIGAMAKLTVTGTGDTLSDRDHPLIVAPIQFPTPTFAIAVQPKTKADSDKLGTVLSRLCEEDLTLRLHRETDTSETILYGMGESHIQVAAERMLRKFGVGVNLSVPKVPYKETINIPTKAEYRHRKQTGGHGQYGHVLLELEPLPRGGGFEFAERVVGGSVPKNYFSSVEKGVIEAVQEGVLCGYPIIDIKVTLYDGSYHAVDSSDMAFKIAAAQAVKKGLSQGKPILVEPIMNIKIVVPESLVGDIIGDLNTKRARVLRMNPASEGASEIEALVPLAEVQRYTVDLRSMTQGRGSYNMQFDHYEEVPAQVSQRILAEKSKAGG